MTTVKALILYLSLLALIIPSSLFAKSSSARYTQLEVSYSYAWQYNTLQQVQLGAKLKGKKGVVWKTKGFLNGVIRWKKFEVSTNVGDFVDGTIYLPEKFYLQNQEQLEVIVQHKKHPELVDTLTIPLPTVKKLSIALDSSIQHEPNKWIPMRIYAHLSNGTILNSVDNEWMFGEKDYSVITDEDRMHYLDKNIQILCAKNEFVHEFVIEARLDNDSTIFCKQRIPLNYQGTFNAVFKTKDGTRGYDGVDGECCKEDSDDGVDGEDGGNGLNGYDAQEVWIAFYKMDIGSKTFIRSIFISPNKVEYQVFNVENSEMVVQCRGGSGGDGGFGGDGGNGLDETEEYAQGMRGHGGKGGNGGNGGKGADVKIFTNEESLQYLDLLVSILVKTMHFSASRFSF